MEQILQRIKDMRNEKGFSYEYMAMALDISSSAYRKIEYNETKLTVERFVEIAKVLETTASKLLGDNHSNVFYNNNYKDNGTFNTFADVEHYYHQENKATMEKLIHTMELEIEHQREEIVFLRGMLHQK